MKKILVIIFILLAILSCFNDVAFCEEKDIADTMNQLIADDLPVTFEYVTCDNLPPEVSTERLPEDVSETIRLVRIGDYDVCPCIGKHVRSTSQIGHFELLGTNWDEMTHAFRIRFKVVQ